MSTDDDTYAFTCGAHDGAATLDAYLRTQALRDHTARVSTVWLAIDAKATAESRRIAGFFSISPLSIPISPALLSTIALSDATYRTIGGYLLGRLAVAAHLQGQRLGDVLVYSALRISATAGNDAGGAFMAVDPKNERLASWYERLGFQRLDPVRRRMVKRL